MLRTPTWLKALFITGYRPTQNDFGDVFDSFVPRSEMDWRPFKVTTTTEETPIEFNKPFPDGTDYIALGNSSSGDSNLWYQIFDQNEAGFKVRTEAGSLFQGICIKI